jgi:hypothetical protein
MPKYQYTEEENERFDLLKAADYPFEIVGYDSGISKSQKTNGCDQMELKLRFFTDTTFSTPVGQWTETLTFPDSGRPDTDRFLQGRLNMFVKSANMRAAIGQEIEFDEVSTVGLRGWAHVTQEPKQTKNPTTQKYEAERDEHGKPIYRNKVSHFPTDKPRLERAPRKVEPENEWDEAK